MRFCGAIVGCLMLLVCLGCETVPCRASPHQQKTTDPIAVKNPIELQKQASEKIAAARLKKEDIDTRDLVLRPFALREAPSIWRSIQNLRAESEVLAANYRKLERELREFGRNPAQDADLKKIKLQKDAIDEMHDRVYMKLEDAYIAAAKFEAKPSSKGYENMKRTMIADGVAEAELATQKFNSLRK